MTAAAISFAFSVLADCRARLKHSGDGAGDPLNNASGGYSQAVQQHEHVTNRRQVGRGSGSCMCACGSSARAVTMHPHSLHWTTHARGPLMSSDHRRIYSESHLLGVAVPQGWENEWVCPCSPGSSADSFRSARGAEFLTNERRSVIKLSAASNCT